MNTDAAARLLARAETLGLTIATAESLTGGLVADALVSVPGASSVFRGGVVSYATQLKRDLLGIDQGLLAECGAVDARVAAQMAERVRIVCGGAEAPVSLGLATTGVAGPAEQDGHPAGEVYLAVATGVETRVQHHRFAGDRESIRSQAPSAVIELALVTLGQVATE